MKEEHVIGPIGQRTVFCQEDGRVWLSQLCGERSAGDDPDVAPVFQAAAVVSTSLGQFDRGELAAVESSFDNDSARILWQMADGALELQSTWSCCPTTGVLSRKDTLTNRSGQAVRVFRVQARFAFPPGSWNVYAQDSRWCNENQGVWRAVHAGSIRLACVEGRTTQGGTPYVALREGESQSGLALHVLPRGNWEIDVHRQSVMNGPLYLVVTLGMAAEEMRMDLEAGASFDCPEILIQPLPEGEPSRAAPHLHRYVSEHLLAAARPELPVVYNTWFEQFEVLEVPRLRAQLEAAKRLGCEVFVVDAGWYGPNEGDWFAQAGDWRERTTAAFDGKMNDFADEVREAGLGFGLWMEPERFGPGVPVRQEHPEWFVPGAAGFARIDLQRPEAYDYLRGEISRLVQTYRLAWMKIDFNFELGRDPTGAELSGYYAEWYRLLDEIRGRHPDTVFEGCASGGMRFDLTALAHCDGHFLTDTVSPIEVLRIWQGALLRLPPGGIIKWLVLRGVGRTIPTYTKSLADSPVSVVAPGCALWEPSETVDVDFAAAVAMPGVFGFSGDLASLPEEAGERLRRHVAFFKQWRSFIRRASAHLLTPPHAKDDRQGWAAVELSDAEGATSLLFVYRLDDGAATRRIHLRGLDPAREYEVAPYLPEGQKPQRRPGAELMQDGWPITLPAKYRAAIVVVRGEVQVG
jgi:alpha-galactosidase